MKSWIKKLLTFILVAIVLFLLLEVFLRVCFHQKLRKRHYAELYQPDTLVGYRYIPGAEDYACNPAFYHEVKINSLGHDEHEFTKEKDPNNYRIVFVGCSDDVGINSYINVMARKFKAQNSRVEILNCSMPGTDREVQNVNKIQQQIILYNPDLVIMTGHIPFWSKMEYRSHYRGYQIKYHDWNRLETLKNYIDNTHDAFSWFSTFYDLFYSFRWICKYYTENDNKFTLYLQKCNLLSNKNKVNEYVTQQIEDQNGFWEAMELYSVEESLELFRQTNELLKKQNARLAFSDKTDQSQLRGYLLNYRGIEYLSTNLSYDRSFSWGETDGHTTPEGHKRISEEYYKELINSQLIPRQFLGNDSADFPYLDSQQKEEMSLSKLSIKSINNTATLSSLESVKILYVNPLKNELTGINYNNEIGNYLAISDIKSKREDVSIPYKVSVTEFIEKLDSAININHPDFLVIQLPGYIFNMNPEKSYKLISDYATYLNRNGIEPIFFYEYFSIHGMLPFIYNKHIAGYMLRQNNIRCVGVESNILDYYTPEKSEESINKRSFAIANNVYTELISALIEAGTIKQNYNKAYRKNVSYSSYRKTSVARPFHSHEFEGSEAVDGIKQNICTWSDGWISDTLKAKINHSEWIMVDMETIQFINRLVLYPRSVWGTKTKGFPVDFEIQVSNNQSNWQTITSKENYPTPAFQEAQIFDFPIVKARYIRVVSDKLRQDEYAEGKLYRMAFNEIEVY